MPHIAIIGAGITGVTTAYALADRGFEVTVIDRHRYAAMETSFANGGQLSASNAEVWNSAVTVMKGIRWMFSSDAPLLVNPLPTWHKYSWMAEFVGQIRNYRANTIETTRLAIESRRHLFDIAQRENIEFDLERRGILHVYHDKKSFDAAATVNTLLKAGGLDRHAVTSDEIRAIEPALTGSYHGGFFTPSDSTGDIHKFTRGLATACARRGVSFMHDTVIGSIDNAGKQFKISHTRAKGLAHAAEQPVDAGTLLCDRLVVCAGVNSRHFAAMLGDRVNIYPVKGYSITVGMDDEQSQKGAPWVSLLDDSAKIVTSRLDANRFRVAGTAEFNGFNRDIRADRIQPLIDWTRRHFSTVDTSKVIPWSGLRPMLPSMLPRVSAGKRPGVYYNTGHGHLGWTLAAATAQLVAAMVER
jgi:D-amino-acid dehydrogenase